MGLKREGGDIRSQGLNSVSGVKRTGTVLYMINCTVPYRTGASISISDFFEFNTWYLQRLRARIQYSHVK